jgi:hypothetical protein
MTKWGPDDNDTQMGGIIGCIWHCCAQHTTQFSNLRVSLRRKMMWYSGMITFWWEKYCFLLLIEWQNDSAVLTQNDNTVTIFFPNQDTPIDWWCINSTQLSLIKKWVPVLHNFHLKDTWSWPCQRYHIMFLLQQNSASIDMYFCASQTFSFVVLYILVFSFGCVNCFIFFCARMVIWSVIPIHLEHIVMLTTELFIAQPWWRISRVHLSEECCG